MTGTAYEADVSPLSKKSGIDSTIVENLGYSIYFYVFVLLSELVMFV